MMSRPTHAQDRHVVVLSGTWWTGTGKDFDPSKAVPLKASGYNMMHPAVPCIGTARKMKRL
jgi:hypothetical protein